MSEGFLKGNIALVSGSYRNLGIEIALALAERGADIVLNDLPNSLSEEEKKALCEQVGSHGVWCTAIDGDISSYSFLQSLRDRIKAERGTVSIIINCAGPFNLSPLLDLEEKDWNTVMDVNLKAVYLSARCFAADMKKAGWGRIVSLSAGSAFVRNHGVYGLAKEGVRFLTQELALELGPEITINAVAPGQIEESLPLIHQIDPTFGERYTQRAPLKKLVRRRNVAELISFLCSPAADLITGETIRIDGGAELPRF